MEKKNPLWHSADTLVACKHNCSESDSLTWPRSGTQVSSTPDLETVENTVVQRGYMATPTLSAVPESANLNEQCTQCTQQQKIKKINKKLSGACLRSTAKNDSRDVTQHKWA